MYGISFGPNIVHFHSNKSSSLNNPTAMPKLTKGERFNYLYSSGGRYTY